MSPTPLAAGLCTCHHAQSRRLPPCRYHVEGRISFSGGLVNLFDGVALCILNRAMKKRYLWKHPIGGNTVATVEDEEKAMGEAMASPESSLQPQSARAKAFLGHPICIIFDD
ncbi:uncharacterized protein LOC21388476 [Morus notabilis]|uniref:uncharacterized protein LOC21388476 n=1 Tax=Morus notabilis TaxID=981085 RepID=UPI000CED3887|nr:uncharacterized protein LOC21388476 [Morus notabilis]